MTWPRVTWGDLFRATGDLGRPFFGHERPGATDFWARATWGDLFLAMGDLGRLFSSPQTTVCGNRVQALLGFSVWACVALGPLVVTSAARHVKLSKGGVWLSCAV